MTSKTYSSQEKLDIMTDIFYDLKNKYDKLKDYKIKVDKAKTRCACCKYNKKLITISKYYLTSKHIPIQDYKDTMYHEIAHVLTRGEHHNKIWKAKCIEIGGSGKTRSPYSMSVEYKYKIKCEEGCLSGFHRRPKNIYGFICKKHKKPLKPY